MTGPEPGRPPRPRRRAWDRPPVRMMLALATALAGCAGVGAPGADRSGELLSTSPARSARCTAEAVPHELPGADAVVDSAALVTAVRDLWSENASDGGYVLLTLAFDTAGANARRDVIEHSVRPWVADSVQQLVFESRRQVGRSEQEWGVRLRVELTEPVGLRVGRREFCPPVARNREVDEAMHGLHPVGVRHRGLVQERTIHMRALVDELGTIVDARIHRGEHPGSQLERDLAHHLRQFLFLPATVDGVPTRHWVTIAVLLRS